MSLCAQSQNHDTTILMYAPPPRRVGHLVVRPKLRGRQNRQPRRHDAPRLERADPPPPARQESLEARAVVVPEDGAHPADQEGGHAGEGAGVEVGVEVGEARPVQPVEPPPLPLGGLEGVDVAAHAREEAEGERGAGPAERDEGEPGDKKEELLDDAEEVAGEVAHGVGGAVVGWWEGGRWVKCIDYTPSHTYKQTYTRT